MNADPSQARGGIDWNTPGNAEQYDRYADAHPMIHVTSRALLALADLGATAPEARRARVYEAYLRNPLSVGHLERWDPLSMAADLENRVPYEVRGEAAGTTHGGARRVQCASRGTDRGVGR